MKITAEAAKKYPALEELVSLYSSRQQKSVFWEDKVHAELEIVDALPNKLIWEFKVEEKHCNQLGNIHGGCVATIIDICSSFAILTYEGKGGWSLIGVSTDLAVSYMSGIAAGQTCRLECDVQRVGKTLANIYTTVYNEDGKLCYSGSHTKYCIDSRL
ncbi:HotDog domain-containing protein [Phascolomyces articulosus]|uniref:HotDog domain-containing protein n=1 Tax=Phascolomyces articulosus TaxID=60185 RepID=A0AAD5JVU1_9FUNG|nr:HotDog domain-containing protein [Phascolomyces articulosus]